MELTELRSFQRRIIIFMQPCTCTVSVRTCSTYVLYIILLTRTLAILMMNIVSLRCDAMRGDTVSTVVTILAFSQHILSSRLGVVSCNLEGGKKERNATIDTNQCCPVSNQTRQAGKQASRQRSETSKQMRFTKDRRNELTDGQMDRWTCTMQGGSLHSTNSTAQYCTVFLLECRSRGRLGKMQPILLHRISQPVSQSSKPASLASVFEMRPVRAPAYSGSHRDSYSTVIRRQRRR